MVKNSGDGSGGGVGVGGDFINKTKYHFVAFTIFKNSDSNFDLFSFINSNINKFLFIFLSKNKIKIKQ